MSAKFVHKLLNWPGWVNAWVRLVNHIIVFTVSHDVCFKA